ncbi:MAG: TonB-dependent receptor [Flavobacteriales bacterium]|nr:TonB-dependent receptor [Flavobacteriales bacterium]
MTRIYELEIKLLDMNIGLKRIFCLSILFVGIVFSVLAQDEDGTITGQIVDEKGQPLIGANVVVDDSTGTATDIDGNFTIKVRPGLHKILCRFLGCDSQTQNITIVSGERFTLNVELKEAATDLGTVVVSAGKFEQRIEEVTVSMAVIDPELVESKGTTNMETAVNQAPGVMIIDSEPQIRSGSGYSFGAGSRVMIIVDDLPILSGDAGRPAWNFLPVENLEQIEIIKGASSVMYGSAALNGVINIRTAYPKDEPQTKINIYTGIYDNPKRKHAIYWDDSNPIFSGMNFFHSRKIGNWDLVIGGNLFSDNGYIGPAPEEAVDSNKLTLGTAPDTTNYYRQQNIGEFENRTRMNTNIRYRHPKIEGLNFGINLNGMYSRSAGALIMLDTDTGMYRSFPGAITKTLKWVGNIDPFLNYYGKKGAKHTIRTRIYYIDNQNTNGQANQSTLYYGQYQYQKKFQKYKDLIITSGITGNYSESNSQLYQGNEGGSPLNFSGNYAIFMQLDKKFWDRVTISAGGRYETFRINKSDDEGKPVFRAGVSSRVLKETYVRASFGEGFRAPTIAEKYILTAIGPMAIYPNDDILSEKSWNAEVGIKQGVKAGKFYGYLDVAVFRQLITNSLEFSFGVYGDQSDPNVPNQGLGFKSINVGQAQISGVDASVVGKGQLGPFELNLLAGYTYTEPIALTPDDTVQTGLLFYSTYAQTSSDTTGSSILKYRMKHLIKFDLNVKYKKLAVGMSMRYNSFMVAVDKVFEDLDDGGPYFILEGRLPTGIHQYRVDRKGRGDYVFDARISYELNESARVAFIVNNMLNREYMIRPLNIESPRTGQLQFTIKF